MSARATETWNLPRFLVWEAEQECKHEFDGYEPIAMAGGTEAHAGLQANLEAALVSRLRGGACRFRGSELKLQTGRDTMRYPDGMVLCTPADPRATVVHNPVVVFEVLNDSSQRTNRIAKMAEYRATPSIRSYVMLEQSHAQATVFSRTGDGQWLGRVLRAGDMLDLPEIDMIVPVDEIYQGISLEDLPTPAL